MKKTAIKTAGKPRKKAPAGQTQKKKTVKKTTGNNFSLVGKTILALKTRHKYPIAVITPLHPLKINLQSWNKIKVMAYIENMLSTNSRGLFWIINEGLEKFGAFPSYSSIMEWLSRADILIKRGGGKKKQMQIARELLESYARGRENQAVFITDEMVEIADDGRNDWMEKLNKDGDVIGWTVNGECIQRSRVRIDTRKYNAENLSPKKFGQVAKHELTVEAGATLQVTNNFIVQPVKVLESDDDDG